MKKFFAAAVLMSAMLSGLSLAASPDEMKNEVAARHDRVIVELQKMQEGGEIAPEAALSLIQREISPLIDYRRFASSAAGKYWRRATDEEKMQIAAAFRVVLERSYAKILSSYTGQRAEIVEAKVRADKKILVGMEVHDGERAGRIDYLFDGEPPRVVDAQVEKISLLSAWRRQFAQIAKKSGTAGLAAELQKLADKE